MKRLLDAPIPRICLENPVSVISTRIRKPDQIIQPWMFGHETSKRHCLWLKNLPKLTPTNVVGKGEIVIQGGKRFAKWYSNGPAGAIRTKKRSRTFEGVAKAFASQWGL